MSLFKPKAPRSIQPGETYRIQINEQRQYVHTPLPELEPALSRVVNEIARLRIDVHAGESARSIPVLEAEIVSCKQQMDTAGKACDTQRRQVIAGIGDPSALNQAIADHGKYVARFRALDAERQRRNSADSAAQALDAIWHRLA